MKLHLGCGEKYIPGFVHIDVQPFPQVDHVAPVEKLALIQDGTVDLIYACHVLEHFGRHEIHNVLCEWQRALKDGGILRLAVPDFAAVVKVYKEDRFRDGYSGLLGLLCGGQRHSFDYHNMIFDEELLVYYLKKAGFRETRLWDWRKTEHAHIDDYSQSYLPHLAKENGTLMSLNMEAVK